MKKTKVVCTIGPASNSPEILEELIRAGMNVARLNFSHGTHEEHGVVVKAIREVSERLHQPVAILQDIAGPKIRVGEIEKGPVTLAPGQLFTITDRDVPGNDTLVSVNYKSLPQLVEVGDVLLLADGTLELKVVRTTDQDIECRVVVGGSLNSHKGVNLPSRSTGIPILTEKDKLDLAFGVEMGVDYVALSFVRTAEDVRTGRKLLKELGADTPLIAKIEKPEALKNIDEIIELVDGVMVARGDLGVELPFEQVPRAQKDLINRANAACKPVITATQMLESMVENPRPTRAEVTDVANAILDGTDAVMLSEESAMGKFPVKAVQAMARIAEDVEQGMDREAWLAKFRAVKSDDVERAVSHAACDMADRLDIAAIIATTTTGRTARLMARFRPARMVLAPTPSETTYRRLALVWGVHPFMIPQVKYTDEMIACVFDMAVKLGYLQNGQKAVVSAGVPAGVPGQTNFVAVLEAGQNYVRHSK